MNNRINNPTTVAEAGFGCGCVVAMLLCNLTLGAICFDYSLHTIFDKDVPWWADALGGLVLGEFTIPIAVVCWILQLCGIPAPFIG